MVIQVPQDFPNIQDAVNAASPGDTILVADGVYNESVHMTTDFVRVIAVGKDVVLDGSNNPATSVGFRLVGVNGVAVEKFRIANYPYAGVWISGGGFNRIAHNKVLSSGGNNIELDDSTGNVLWKNELIGAGADGIDLAGSSSNWIVENKIRNSSRGIDIFPDGSGNGIIGNTISDSGIDGITDQADGNNVALYNQIYDSGSSGIGGHSSNSAYLDNDVKTSSSQGIWATQPNLYIADNEIEVRRYFMWVTGIN